MTYIVLHICTGVFIHVYINLTEDISERSLIFYLRKSIKFKMSLSFVNVAYCIRKIIQLLVNILTTVPWITSLWLLL